MKVIETPIGGVLRIVPDVYGDERGFFLESFHAKKFAALGIPHLFVQDNHSRSAMGVLRGLHFQKRHPQGKLVRVLSGSLFDRMTRSATISWPLRMGKDEAEATPNRSASFRQGVVEGFSR